MRRHAGQCAALQHVDQHTGHAALRSGGQRGSGQRLDHVCGGHSLRERQPVAALHRRNNRSHNLRTVDHRQLKHLDCGELGADRHHRRYHSRIAMGDNGQLFIGAEPARKSFHPLRRRLRAQRCGAVSRSTIRRPQPWGMSNPAPWSFLPRMETSRGFSLSRRAASCMSSRAIRPREDRFISIAR